MSFALVIVFLQTRIAMGLYLVLFSWLVVAAFKMGMIYQQKAPAALNATLNVDVITRRPKKARGNRETGGAGDRVANGGWPTMNEDEGARDGWTNDE